MDFENTAAYSRDYQASQECMCDGEHMFDCSGQDQNDGGRQLTSNLESYLARQFHTSEHKNLVAKKFQPHKVSNSAINFMFDSFLELFISTCHDRLFICYR